jgi:hypothetical protein
MMDLDGGRMNRSECRGQITQQIDINLSHYTTTAIVRDRNLRRHDRAYMAGDPYAKRSRHIRQLPTGIVVNIQLIVSSTDPASTLETREVVRIENVLGLDLNVAH